MRCLVIAAIATFTITLADQVVAHGGGLNASGCHNNRKTGGYHCHRGGGSTRLVPSAPFYSGSSGPALDELAERRRARAAEEKLRREILDALTADALGDLSSPYDVNTPLILNLTPRTAPIPNPKPRYIDIDSATATTTEPLGISTSLLPAFASPSKNDSVELRALIVDMQNQINTLRSEVLDLKLRVIVLEQR